MFVHSSSDGRCRFSGLAFQSEDRSTSRNSARPSSGFLLLAGQPFPDRRHEVVMGEQKELLAHLRLGLTVAFRFLRFDWADQPQFAVEDAKQFVKLVRAGAVAGDFQEFPVRPHVPFDVGPGLGQQCPQDGLSGLLVDAIRRRGRPGAEGLLQERDPDPFRPADLLQGLGSPGLPLEHLGEQRQSNRDHPAFLGQPLDRSIQKFVLLAGHPPRIVRQHPVATSELNQHLAGVLEIEEINDSEVLILILSDPDDRHEAVQGHREIIPYQDDRLDSSPVALR